MKISGLRLYASRALSLFLILEMAFGTFPRTVRADELTGVPNAFASESLGRADVPDFALVAGQRRLDRVAGQLRPTPLNTPDIDLTPVPYSSFQREVAIGWNQYKPEFQFLAGQSAHIFDNMQVTGEPILDSLANFIFIPTTEGIRLITTKDVKQFGFVAPIPAYLVAPLPWPEARIESLKLIERDTPRDSSVLNADGTPLPAILGRGDLLASLRLPDGQLKKVRWDLDVLQMNLSVEMIGVLVELVLQSPDEKSIEPIAEFLKKHDALVKRYQANRALVEATGKENLAQEGLRRMAERGGTASQRALVEEVLKVTQSSRDRFPADATNMLAASRSQVETLLGKQTLPAASEQLTQAQSALDELELGKTGSQKTFVGKFARGAHGLWKRIAHPKALLGLSGILGGGTTYAHFQPDSFLGHMGAPLIRAISHLWSNLLAMPGFHIFAKPDDLKASLDFILGSANTLTWLGGTTLLSFGVYASFLVLGYGAGWLRHWVTGREAPGTEFKKLFAEMNRATFEIMRDGYLWMNRAIEGAVTFLLGQRNLFKAMLAGIPATNLRAWNLAFGPLVRGQDVQRGREAVNREIGDRSRLRAAAMEIATAVLASELTGTPLPVLLSRKWEPSLAIEQLVGTPEGAARLSEILVLCREALEEMRSGGDLTLDAAAVEKNLPAYLGIAQAVQARAQEAPTVGRRLLRVGAAAKEYLGGTVVPTILGLRGARLFQRYYGSRLNPAAQDQATHMAGVDYNASVGYLAVVSGKDMASLAPRLVGGQAEQAAFVFAQLPADISPDVDATPLQNPNPSLAAGLFTEATRKQNLFEGLGNVLTGWLKRDAHEKGLLDFWHGWIANMRDGWFTRSAIATGSMMLVFLGKMHKGEIAFDGTVDFFLTSLQTAWVWMMQKMAIGYDFTNGMFFVGYAMVWPMISSWMDQNKRIIGENLAALQGIATRIWQGVELGNAELWKEGVRELKKLYADAGEEIPTELNVDSAGYSAEMALSLLAYARKQAPLPTGQNGTLKFLLNFVWGAGLSTLIYNSVNVQLTTDPPGALRVLATFGFLAAGFVGSKIASEKIVKPAIEKIQPGSRRLMGWVKQVKNSCKKVLLRQEPVNAR